MRLQWCTYALVMVWTKQRTSRRLLTGHAGSIVLRFRLTDRMPAQALRPKLEKQRRKFETEQAYGRSEEASKASETENQLVHLQRPSEKRLTIESSSVSQWACLQYARGRVRCQSQWKSRIGTYVEVEYVALPCSGRSTSPVVEYTAPLPVVSYTSRVAVQATSSGT